MINHSYSLCGRKTKNRSPSSYPKVRNKTFTRGEPYLKMTEARLTRESTKTFSEGLNINWQADAAEEKFQVKEIKNEKKLYSSTKFMIINAIINWSPQFDQWLVPLCACDAIPKGQLFLLTVSGTLQKLITLIAPLLWGYMYLNLEQKLKQKQFSFNPKHGSFKLLVQKMDLL